MMNKSLTLIGLPGSVKSQWPNYLFSRKENSLGDHHPQNQPSEFTLPEKSGPFRVVLADDDEDDRDLFEEAVVKLGTQVKLEVVNDGAELLKLLRSADSLPDIVFLDLNMPNKNGRESLTEIRSSPELKDLVVVIYSTSSSPKDVDETFEIGANLYVCKPSSFKGLKAMISEVIELSWESRNPKTDKKNYVYSQ